MSNLVTAARDGAVLSLTLNRPEKKNALTAQMYLALIAAFDEADADEGLRAIVIQGAGGNFTAGNDIGDFLSGGSFADFPALRFIRRLAMLETPLVAAVEGVAIGVGTTLLFHCDLVYATADARLQTPFVNLALTPEAGASLLMPRRLGVQKASEMLMLAEPIDGREAWRLGLVNEILDSAALRQRAMERAQALAKKPPAALAATRRMLRGDPAELRARIETEAVEFGKAMASQEAREVFAAFMSRSR